MLRGLTKISGCSAFRQDRTDWKQRSLASKSQTL